MKRTCRLITSGLFALVAVSGCVNSGDKNSCVTTDDCLNGYQCLGQECVIGRDAAVVDAGPTADAAPLPACVVSGVPDAGNFDAGPPQPDLVVLATAVLADGFRTQIDYAISNRGDGNASGFEVAMFMNENSPPTVGATSDKLASHPGLAAGQTVAGTIFALSQEERRGTAYLYVDALQEVSESNEGNNLSVGVLYDSEWTSPGPIEDAASGVFHISTFPNAGSVAATEVSVHNASGTLLTKTDGPGCYAELVLALDVAANPSVLPYQIRVSGVPGFAAGSYSVSVTTTGVDSSSDAAPSDPDVFEPDNDCAMGATIAVDGEPQDHTIAPFETDCIRFSP